MRVAIVTNNREKKGLWRDARILEAILVPWGHVVTIHDFRDVERGYDASVTIHLEVVAPKALWWGDKHIWFPNLDWATKDYLGWTDAFSAVCSKTRHGLSALRGVKRVIYTGFESEDRRRPIKKERRFFHAWGGSLMKGTRSVLAAFALDGMADYPRTILFGSRPMPDSEYRREQNRCTFWIQPSACEGFGHILHEGLGCGALVATLDAPPMNELGMAKVIPCRKYASMRLADLWEARPEAIAEAAKELWEIPDSELENNSAMAREVFETERIEFRRRLRDVLENL
jgi:hypothetical protein